MDVALHGADHDLALRGNRRVPVAARRLLDGLEPGLSGLGARHELRQEERAFLEPRAHLVESGNQHLVDGVHRVVLGDDAGDDLGHRAFAPGEDEGSGLFLGGLGGRISARRGTRRRSGSGPRRSGAAGRELVGAIGVMGNVVLSALVFARKHAPGIDDVHHPLDQRVHDRHVQARRKGAAQERGVHERAERQAEADIREAKHRTNTGELPLDGRDRVQNRARRRLVRGGGHAEAVDDHVLARDTDGVGRGDDLAGNRDAALCRGRDAVFVEREAHDRATVVLGNGQDRGQGLFFAVRGVDERLARIRTYRGLDYFGLGRVYLQGQRRHALELRDELNHHGALVYLGQAGVYIQDLRARLGLGDGLAHDVIVVAGAQGLLHLLLARGVDALADDADLPGSQGNQLLRAGDAEPIVGLSRRGRPPGKKLALTADVIGGRAAATADDGYASVDHLGNGLAVLGRVDVIEGNAVFHARKAGVRLDHDRALRPGKHALHERHQVLGAKRAVDAHDVGAEGRERHGGDLGRRTQERAAVLSERHGHEDRQVGVLAHGEKGRLGLGKIGHGLDDEQVGARLGGGTRLLRKELVRVVEGQRAHGLEELARRADVGRNVADPRPAGTANGRLKDLLHRRRVAELLAVRAERVRRRHVRSGGHVSCVDIAYLVRVGKAQELRELAGREPALLELCAHGAVEDEELLTGKHPAQVVVLHAKAAGLQAALWPRAVELLP